MKLIANEWLSYRERVIPREAGSSQVTESRRAFYAGAWAFYMLLMKGMSGAEGVTEYDMNLMKALDNELREFTHNVQEGRA